VKVNLARESETGIQSTDAVFRLSLQSSCNKADFDFQSVQADLIRQLDIFTNLGSNWSLISIDDFVLHIAKYCPLIGSIYMILPTFLYNKKALINPKNEKDEECFKWCVLAALCPPTHNAERITNYYDVEKHVDWRGLKFPVTLAQIKPFERNNPMLNINVYVYEPEIVVNPDDLEAVSLAKQAQENADAEDTVLVKNDIVPVYITKFEKRKNQIDLLLLREGDKSHYVLIKSMSRLVCHRTRSKRKVWVCAHCSQPFSSEIVYNRHFGDCSKHLRQKLIFPSEPDNWLFWKNRACTERYPFVIYADFECMLKPVSGDKSTEKTHVISTHVPASVCINVVSNIPAEDRMCRDSLYDIPLFVYTGEDVMEKTLDHFITLQQRLSCLLGRNVAMLPLTSEEQTRFDAAKSCSKCNELFTKTNHKVRHHCHINGLYIDCVCNSCNLQIKYHKRWDPLRNRTEPNVDPSDVRIPSAHDNDDTFGYNYFLPCVYHGLSNYDSKMLIKYFNRRVVRTYNHETGKHKYENVHIIAQNLERIISMDFCYIRFIDSNRFLNASLSTLVDNLAKVSLSKFVHTSKYFESDSILLYQKGLMPYEYFDSLDRLNDTKLPPKDAFYNSLTEEELTDDEYDRAHEVWNTFGCKTFKDYVNLYVVSDVLLLSDVFESFRTSCMTSYGLDPVQYLSLPGFSFDCMLKFTKVKLELLTDPETHLFFENSIRGGVSVASHRHAIAKNKYIPGFDPDKDESSYIALFDINNLYGHSMARPLAYGGFHFLDDEEMKEFKFREIDPECNVGYVCEVDLLYSDVNKPEETRLLHDKHNLFPCAPESVLITEDMLSSFCKTFNKKHFECKKLIPNLNDKLKYVTHLKNLQLYERLGMTVGTIHRVLKFNQSAWLKPYIDFNTEMRKQATNEFDKNLFKLLNNSVFGKFLENVRLHKNIELVSNARKFLQLISKPHLESFKIVNEQTVLIDRLQTSVVFNKPIYAGFCILDLSKTLMFEFHYDVMMEKYHDRARLLYTDTDSLCYHIKTDDLYDDMMPMRDQYFDTSDYPHDHPLFSITNKKVLGMMKDEMNGKLIKEMVCLRSKMYSILCTDDEMSKLTAKGVKRSYVKKHLKHEMYLKTLIDHECTFANFVNFRSRCHQIDTVNFRKICLSAYDDKRYVLEDGVSTLAYGHSSIDAP
jgi:hypothetical protein